MQDSQLLSVLGSPAIPHRSGRDDSTLTCVQNTNSTVHPAFASGNPPLDRSYSTLQMTNGEIVTNSSRNSSPAITGFNVTPSIVSESCQRRNRKSKCDGNNTPNHVESMINLSKRVSMITNQHKNRYQGETDAEDDIDVDESTCVEYEAVRLRNRSRICSSNNVQQSPAIISSAQRRSNPSKISHCQQNQQQHHGNRQQGSPSILSSLISLDRRLISVGAPGIPAHRSSVNGSPVGSSALSSCSNAAAANSGNDSVRRSALLRSASGIAAAQAAAAAAASASGCHNFVPSYHAHGISTLGPNQQFNYPPLPPIPVPEGSERCIPVPRSLQVSPALTQRSLYAQHLFSQPDSYVSPYCTTSKMQCKKSSGHDSSAVTSGIRSSIGWMKDELLRSSTASRVVNSSDEYNNCVLKSATSEFSFVRPDSPLTLPYNKSRSFYGRPVSVSSGVITSNVNHNANHPSHSSHANGNVATSPSCSSCVPPPLPPPRPPLPKQLSLEESSTLFRCSAAATASVAAARASDRAAAKERIAAIRKAAAASSSSFDGTCVTGATSTCTSSSTSTSSSSGVSSIRSSLPEHHSQSLMMHLSSPSPRPVSYGYHQSNQMHHLKDSTVYDVDYHDEYSQLDPNSRHSSNNCNGKVNDRRKNRMNRILEKSSNSYAQ